MHNNSDDIFCECDTVHTEAVTASSEKMPPDEDICDLSDFFKLLGDSTRLRILWALDGVELCVCDLAEELKMTKSAISHQLSTLRQAKVVKYRRDGKNIFYSLDDSHIGSIIEIGMTHIKHS